MLTEVRILTAWGEDLSTPEMRVPNLGFQTATHNTLLDIRELCDLRMSSGCLWISQGYLPAWAPTGVPTQYLGLNLPTHHLEPSLSVWSLTHSDLVTPLYLR